MCEYCKEGYVEEDHRGDDGIVKGEKGYYIYAEHFRNERVRIDVNYCPKCGRKLE